MKQINQMNLATSSQPSPVVPWQIEHDRLEFEMFRSIDRLSEASIGQFTSGLSPAALSLAFFDCSIHLAAAPGKRAELVHKAAKKTLRLPTASPFSDQVFPPQGKP